MGRRDKRTRDPSETPGSKKKIQRNRNMSPNMERYGAPVSANPSEFSDLCQEFQALHCGDPSKTQLEFPQDEQISKIIPLCNCLQAYPFHPLTLLGDLHRNIRSCPQPRLDTVFRVVLFPKGMDPDKIDKPDMHFSVIEESYVKVERTNEWKSDFLEANTFFDAALASFKIGFGEKEDHVHIEKAMKENPSIWIVGPYILRQEEDGEDITVTRIISGCIFRPTRDGSFISYLHTLGLARPAALGFPSPVHFPLNHMKDKHGESGSGGRSPLQSMPSARFGCFMMALVQKLSGAHRLYLQSDLNSYAFVIYITYGFRYCEAFRFKHNNKGQNVPNEGYPVCPEFESHCWEDKSALRALAIQKPSLFLTYQGYKLKTCGFYA